MYIFTLYIYIYTIVYIYVYVYIYIDIDTRRVMFVDLEPSKIQFWAELCFFCSSHSHMELHKSNLVT